EIILKWDPSNAHDNAHDGYTGNVFFDCYRRFEAYKGTQFVFSDLGTYKPGAGWNVYSEIRRKLAEDYAAFYYDERGRIIQSRTTNHLGGTEVEYVTYNFI
ncbi:hypothetical protein PZH42_29395, partial [Bacteroides cellulosilyticus]|nr:hypothetical protein [Bacteroides cellulosilyticus]